MEIVTGALAYLGSAATAATSVGAPLALQGAVGGTAAAGVAASAASPFAFLGSVVTGIAQIASVVTPILSLTSMLASNALQGQASAQQAAQVVRAGYQQSDNFTAEAVNTDNQGTIEELSADDRQDTMRRDLLRRLGERDVAYASSGVDLSFGTPGQARDEAIADTNRALAIDTETANYNRSRLDERAAGFRQRAREARTGALDQANLIGTQNQISMLRRYR